MTNEYTETEERLIRALAARAEQVTPHSLRPAAPPTGNWAARGRAPLVLALAASVASITLVGTAAVTLLTPPEKAPVAGTPSPVPELPTPGPPTPSAPRTGAPRATEPSGQSTSPAGTPNVPDPGAGTGTGDEAARDDSRPVTLVLGEGGTSRTLRTGGDALTFTLTIRNTTGSTVEEATDNLSITAGGGGLSQDDVNVSLLGADGRWQPIGYEARLTTATLAEGESRTHKIRISLPEDFPAEISTLRITAFSNAGEETLTQP